MSAVPAGLLVAVRKHPGIKMPGYFQGFLLNRLLELIYQIEHRRIHKRPARIARLHGGRLQRPR
jgi:hypothetical protein